MSQGCSTGESTYVTREEWVGETGRPELIDDIADQFERPAASGALAFWSPTRRTRWAPAGPSRWHHTAQSKLTRELSARSGVSGLSR